jgi:hypothetical protein
MLMDNFYDIVVIISSYDRYDMLVNLLNSIVNTKSDYKIKVIVNDDFSTDERYKTISEKFSDMTFIRSNYNKGKDGYWLTITELLNESKKYDFKYLLTIPDDFDICDNFFKLLVKEHEESKKLDDKIVCTSYATITKIKRWRLTYWMDGDGIFDKIFLDKINYTIDKIKPTGKNNGSGVWKQISTKINNLKFKVHKPNVIYVTHLGHTDSKMHKELRKIKKIIIEKNI